MGIVRMAVKLATNFDIAPGVGMWAMMKAMSLEDMMSLGAGSLPRGFLERLNAKLVKINKV